MDIRLAKNAIGDKGLELLTDGLAQSRTVVRIDLSANQLSDKCVCAPSHSVIPLCADLCALLCLLCLLSLSTSSRNAVCHVCCVVCGVCRVRVS